ncbi:hypothetical protein L1887_60197 [Cichorium endivia]|nr:hypothetical protein L1887_60197 [Cichorium endivia]
MTNAFSRPEQTPEPWPITPNADGSLPGDLPLTMPRRQVNSATVVITKRLKKITLYEVRRSCDQESTQCKIDTDNEWLLRTGVALPSGRVHVGIESLARIVAKQMPSRHADRIYVDHADRDPTNDTRENLHWVTPAFNTFNVERGQRASGYVGVRKSGASWMVQFQGQVHGCYSNKKTAARVYDLLCALAYGDQLVKTPHALNNLEQDTHVSLADAQTDGVSIYKVDKIFVVIYDVKVHNYHAKLDDAKRAAQSLVAKLKAERAQKEQQSREMAKTLQVQRNKEGIAMIRCTTRALFNNKPAKEAEILLDDDVWIDLHARSAKVSIGWQDQVTVRIEGKPVSLTRWLCGLGGTNIVDHINRNRLDNRRSNLAVRDRSANAQNSRKGNSLQLHIGVRWRWQCSLWAVQAHTKGQNRNVVKYFEQVDEAVELYDLAALYQHGPDALINRPEKLADYFGELESESTQTRVQDFLEGSSRIKTSRFRGVCVNKQRLWKSKVAPIGKKIHHRHYAMSEKGSEIRAAIAHDLWKLKLISPALVVNFEHLRPCYQHWLPRLTDKTDDHYIEKAYNLLGGDSFDPDEEVNAPTPSTSMAGPSNAPQAESSHPLASSSKTLIDVSAGSSNNPINVSDAPSPLPGSCGAPFHVSDASSVSPPGSPRPSAVALGKRKARD